MLTAKSFSHIGSNGSTPQSRITDSGYALPADSTSWAENLAWAGRKLYTPLASDMISELHRRLFVDANVSGRDVGSIAADIQRTLSAWSKPATSSTSQLPSWTVPDPDKRGETLAGYTVRMRGEVASMQESFRSLGFGLLMAAVLIYLLMVAQFRSFLDPFVIMFAVPLGIIGVFGILYLTGTTINVQSFMGVIFSVGIDVSNSVLLVEFAAI